MTGSPFSEPISALTPELLDRLKEQVETTLVHLIKTNRRTRYARESPLLNEFRAALDALDDANAVVQDEALLESFRMTVPLSAYDAYEPFINQLVAPNPREKDVKDMFSPGLPYFIASSSATSGKTAKLFAKYRHATGSLEDVDAHANPTSDHGGKNCLVYSLAYTDLIKVLDDENAMVAQFPVTYMSAGVIRMRNRIDVEKDPWFITLTAPRATSPVAVSFILNYRSFLLMHVLFALADPQLETINTFFGTMFLDMIHYMEEEWEILVASVETGVLPDWEGTGHVRQYLEPKFSARPERAAHLRAIGKATEQPGWLKKLWPGLNVVIGIASGVFAFVIPKMRHYLGPDVRMSSLGFTSSEAYIGTAYSPTDISLFKATNDEVIEYLNISKAENASNLAFGHQVDVGRRYEVVVTTRDGLWRYRLGDVIEIAGFDPSDDTPILRYIERRGASLRLVAVLLSEEHLASAIASVQDVLGSITEFTVFVDEQRVPASLVFLVELDGELSALADQAPARLEDALCRVNENVVSAVQSGQLGPPTVHVLQPGTCREYRASKIKAAVTGTGQIKVPAVLRDRETQAWMLRRVKRVIAPAPVSR